MKKFKYNDYRQNKLEFEGVHTTNKYRIMFSPTGGTEKVAKAITKEWDEVEDIDLSIADKDYNELSLKNNDIAMIAMPSFGGLAPQLALDRLAKIKVNHCKCVIVAAYGNRAYEDTLVQMEDYAIKAGFIVIAAVSAVAEHSIIYQYATGRPDDNDCKKLAEFGTQILAKARKKDDSEPRIPGNRPYKKASAGMIPKTSKLCAACGLCADKCPAGAINKRTPKITDKKKCISCMRCVAECPKQARKVSEFMTAIAGMAIKKTCSVSKECELLL